MRSWAPLVPDYAQFQRALTTENLLIALGARKSACRLQASPTGGRLHDLLDPGQRVQPVSKSEEPPVASDAVRGEGSLTDAGRSCSPSKACAAA